jgi:hypothetical protein
MVETHPFSIKIEADPSKELSFYWAICEGNRTLVRSPNSYATQQEAEKWASDVLKRAETRHKVK